MKYLGYEYFYDLAHAINDVEQTCSDRELATFAYGYLCDFESSVDSGRPDGSIEPLLTLLKDYGEYAGLHQFYDDITSQIYKNSILKNDTGCVTMYL